MSNPLEDAYSSLWAMPDWDEDQHFEKAQDELFGKQAAAPAVLKELSPLAKLMNAGRHVDIIMSTGGMFPES